MHQREIGGLSAALGAFPTNSVPFVWPARYLLATPAVERTGCGKPHPVLDHVVHTRAVRLFGGFRQALALEAIQQRALVHLLSPLVRHLQQRRQSAEAKMITAAGPAERATSSAPSYATCNDNYKLG